jgi:hypothetical protein
MGDESYQKEAEKYLKIYFDAISNLKSTPAFHHFCGNLVTNLISYGAIISDGKDQEIETHKKQFDLYLNAVKIYFNLLEKYPEFKDKEFTQQKGYFPELYDILHRPRSPEEHGTGNRLFRHDPSIKGHYVSPAVEYVSRAREKLEKIAQSAG